MYAVWFRKLIVNLTPEKSGSPASWTPFALRSLKAWQLAQPPVRAVSANERLTAGGTVTTKLSGAVSTPKLAGGV